VTVENNYIHHMTHWNHDPARSDGTHNDSIQVQGGKNIAIRYDTVSGRSSPATDSSPTERRPVRR